MKDNKENSYNSAIVYEENNDLENGISQKVYFCFDYYYFQSKENKKLLEKEVKDALLEERVAAGGLDRSVTNYFKENDNIKYFYGYMVFIRTCVIIKYDSF